MKKNYYYLILALTIIGCESAEDLVQESRLKTNPTQTYIINEDIEHTSEITDGSKPKKPIFIYDIPPKTTSNLTTKSSEESTILNFNYGIIGYTKSGCTIKRYNDGNSYYTDDGVYGTVPYNYDGYLIRGFGLPHHNFYYNSLVLITRNRPKQTISRGQIINSNDSKGSAISIEYQFETNVTYEISLTTYFNDNGVTTDFKPSEGFPTVFVQLKDSPIISENQDISCDDNQIVRLTESNPNYLKSYILENNIKQIKILTFNFSVTESKKALLIAINPKQSDEVGVNAKIPASSYTVSLRSVKITKKAFDPSIILPLPPGRR